MRGLFGIDYQGYLQKFNLKNNAEEHSKYNEYCEIAQKHYQNIINGGDVPAARVQEEKVKSWLEE